VRVLIECEPNVRVTSLTNGAADIGVGRDQRNACAQQEQPSGHTPNIEKKSLNTCKF
jgi:hypothetical protein